MLGRPLEVPAHIVKAIDITDICSEQSDDNSIMLRYAWVANEMLVIDIYVSEGWGFMVTQRQIEENLLGQPLSRVAQNCGLTTEALSKVILENAPEKPEQ